jgi:hypothetical protein
MSHSHPVLTPFQYAALNDAAKTEGNVFLVPLPIHRDCKFLEKELYNRADAIDELRRMGLMKNVCKKYFKLLTQQNRGFLAYALTETGRLLFQNSSSRAVN